MTTEEPEMQLDRIPLAYAKAVACADGETRDGWALPCGCLVHYYDGVPDESLLASGFDYTLVVAPHLHVSVGCDIH